MIEVTGACDGGHEVFATLDLGEVGMLRLLRSA
jgi:hypothetical protein